MMKKIIFTIGVLVSCSAYSQVGIDTETPKATLDVTGKPSDLTKTDGIIAPRLKGSELKAKDALYTAEQKASLVYVTEALASANTTAKTVNVTSIGYFYFDGSVWQKLNTGSSGTNGNDWSLLGNSGTTAGTNFIGTTDAKDFVRKTDNVERERTYKAVNDNNVIKTITGGDLNVNGITVGKGKNNNANNTAVGLQTLFSNTTGGFNTGMGGYALKDNTTGNSNVAIGHSSLSKNTTGGSNVAVGASTLVYNTTGTDNIAIGLSALSNISNTNGNFNIGIGFTAGNTLEAGTANNIVIGSKQNLASKTGSNQLNIGGAIFGTGLTGTDVTPAGNISIGKNTPVAGARLDVSGSINGGDNFVGSLGSTSIAVGDSLQAPGINVVAFGEKNIASGKHSAVFGSHNQSTGRLTTVFGTRNIASAPNATSFGADNTSSGYWATTFGVRNTASGANATAFGADNISSGDRSTTFGEGNIAANGNEFVTGMYAAITDGVGNPMFQIGNGNNAANRSNAMTVLKNGNVGLGNVIAPTTTLDINKSTAGAVKIVDGTQGDGKVLMSDANGVGTWQTVASIKPTALGVFPSPSIPEIVSDGGGYKYSEIYIDLTPGKWLVSTGLTVYAFVPNARYFEHVYLSTSQTNLEQNGFVHLGPAGNNTSFSGVLTSGATITPTGGDENANFLSGTSLINVTTATRIYLLLENKPTDYWRFPTRAGENYLYALPVN